MAGFPQAPRMQSRAKLSAPPFCVLGEAFNPCAQRQDDATRGEIAPHQYIRESDACLGEQMREFQVPQVNNARAARGLAMHGQGSITATAAISTDAPGTPARQA